jgi:hypothetical protein
MSVEDVVLLLPSEIVDQEEAKAGEDVKEISKGDANQIEMDLKKIILMIH